MSNGWIGVDLDGTLAHYDVWRGISHIGEPIMPMLARVKDWLAQGKDVRIFTARVDGGAAAITAGNPNGHAHRDVDQVRHHIEQWCLKHIGVVLPVTCQKDYGMIELWDDRAVQVIPNTGQTIADELASVRAAHEGKVAKPPVISLAERARDPAFGKNSVLFGFIPEEDESSRPVLMLGLTQEAWDYMKTGRGHEIDLMKVCGINLKFLMFSGATKEHLKDLLTGKIEDNGFDIHDISGDDVGWDKPNLN